MCGIDQTYKKHLVPEVRDIVIVGENRNYIAVLAVPSTPEIAESQAAWAGVRSKLTVLAKQATGSSQRVLRLALLTRSLSVDAGELTEKGSISQRGIRDAADCRLASEAWSRFAEHDITFDILMQLRSAGRAG